MEAGEPAPFVVGAARSGTTLLRMMLDAHGQLAIPFETQLLPELMDARAGGADAQALAEMLVTHRRWPDFGLDADEIRAAFTSIEPFDLAEAMRAFYRAYAASKGKPRWGDKSPGYALHVSRIGALMPEAHFVHLIRDGRDVRLSQMRRGMNHPTPAKHARRWKRRIQTARRQGTELGRYMELRYESLIDDPEPELRRICEFVALDFDPGMLSYHESARERLGEIDRDLRPGRENAEMRERPLFKASDRLDFHKLTQEPPRADRVAKWKHEMPKGDVAEFERVAGDLLSELGYEVAAKASR
ncbi:MAG: sulfotransferase family protein [Solirubrobacterales bacterium]